MSGVASSPGSFKNPIKFADQDFEKLKAECLASGNLFEDEEFKAEQSSLGTEDDGLGPNTEKAQGLEWKRPKDIKANPAFNIGGFESEDIRQGRLGDCWFLASVACLTMDKDCLSQVVPLDQSFDKDYAGIFHFKFWRYGQWVEVVIDDRLPTKNNKLMFAVSDTSDEFWSALLEKAYAKANGSYEELIQGHILDGMIDLTGGVGEIIDTENAPDDLFQMIQRALMYKCLIGCASPSKTSLDKSSFSPSILKGHVYTLTRAEEVTYGKNKVQLVRLRNPWGGTEWNGAWSDKSEMWNNVDLQRKAELNTDKDEGEFWIDISDFLTEYRRVEICDITMSEVCRGDNYKWCLTEFSGEWTTGSTSGGKISFDTFWTNPQYRITLEAPDGDTSKKCSVVVSLMQKDRRKIKMKKIRISLGLYVYKVSPSDELPLGKEFFNNNEPVASPTKFYDYREVVKRLELLPGDYVIVAATSKPEYEADFYLRVFIEKPTGAQHD